MTHSLADLFKRDLEILKNTIQKMESGNLYQVLPGVTNSCGNLSRHLCGNLQHFIGAILGKTGYERTREAEFNDQSWDKNRLLEEIEHTKELVPTIINSIVESELNKTYPLEVQNRSFTIEAFLLHLYAHLSYHLGQINYLKRILSNT